MPAKKGDIVHVYNKATGNSSLFTGDEDYMVFMNYLAEYLTPLNTDSFKKEFTVKGRTFRGKSHMPKNYFGKIEIIAYALMPDHFHLVLSQNKERAVEQFMRSLSTRYSMYFNKKYKRTGALFQGPYRSAVIEEADLGSLVHYVNNHKTKHSSLLEYKGQKTTSWLRKIGLKGGADKALPEVIVLEKNIKDLERNQPQENLSSSKDDAFNQGTRISAKDKLREKRIPEILASMGVFLILLSLGLLNMTTYAKDDIQTFPTPIPTPTVTETPIPSPIIISRNIVTINSTDGSLKINIYKESSLDAEIIGKAVNGDTFEMLSEDANWYEIKLTDNYSGFVSREHATVESKNL